MPTGELPCSPRRTSVRGSIGLGLTHIDLPLAENASQILTECAVHRQRPLDRHDQGLVDFLEPRLFLLSSAKRPNRGMVLTEFGLQYLFQPLTLGWREDTSRPVHPSGKSASIHHLGSDVDVRGNVRKV